MGTERQYRHAGIFYLLVFLWLYASCLIGLGADIEGPGLGLVVAVLFLPAIGFYLWAMRREARLEDVDLAEFTDTPVASAVVARDKPQAGPGYRPPARRGGVTGRTSDMSWAGVGMAFLAVFGAIAAAFLTFVLVYLVDNDRSETGKEFAAMFRSCERDSSLVESHDVGGRTLEHDGNRVTVHTVVYNVPQEGRRPHKYSHECHKATLVEVTLEGTREFEELDLELNERWQAERDPGWADGEYAYYLAEHGLQALTFGTYGNIADGVDEGPVRGWLVFDIIGDDWPNLPPTLAYGTYPHSRGTSDVVRLPGPTGAGQSR